MVKAQLLLAAYVVDHIVAGSADPADTPFQLLAREVFPEALPAVQPFRDQVMLGQVRDGAPAEFTL